MKNEWDRGCATRSHYAIYHEAIKHYESMKQWVGTGKVEETAMRSWRR